MVKRSLLFLTLLICFLSAVWANAQDTAKPSDSKETPAITLQEDMGEAIRREANLVKEELSQKTRSLFNREPLGWDLDTIQYIYKELFELPGEIPEITGLLLEHGKALGLFGSLLVLIFILAALYGFFGQKRVLSWIEEKARPLGERLPKKYYPYFMSLLGVITHVLIPLFLLGVFKLINAMIIYDTAWFALIGRLLELWTVGAFIFSASRELLTRGYLPLTESQGANLFRWTGAITLYALISIAIVWTMSAFHVREDALAFLKTAIFAIVIVFLFFVFLKKNVFLSLFTDRPYRTYRLITGFLRRYYFTLLIISFLAALLWLLGYSSLGSSVLKKIWFTIAAFLAVSLVYHMLKDRLTAWYERMEPKEESAFSLVRSVKSALLFAAILVTITIALDTLGLLSVFQRLMSFPIVRLGDTQLTLWLILKAVVILLAFFYSSRMLQDYFEYKLYPTLGIDAGLGYALNTFLKYLLLAVGFLVALNIVGLNLKFLLVFAGALGIGIGLGLQNMAANVISGFTIIFGGKIRKGDWIEVSGTLGVVTDIFLRATKVRTRDNIEYLIPNADLISNVMVNYSLSSPLIRMALPVGVSYNADPHEVSRIMVEVARNEPLVENYRQPEARFVEYGDNSINFELLVWMDVKKVARQKLRSVLYYAIFDEFKKAGIEIPFPQRDLHIRSGFNKEETG